MSRFDYNKRENKRPELKKVITFPSQFGEKRISVYEGDMTRFEQNVDLMTISAYYHNYVPTTGTAIEALQEKCGIFTEHLASEPFLDLRHFCGCWISDRLAVSDNNKYIRRIGCLELRPLSRDDNPAETLLTVIQSYFCVLELIALQSIPLKRVAMPLLGTGRQRVEPRLIVVPLISEAINYLRQSPVTSEIVFLEYSKEKADILANALETSYSILNDVTKEEEKTVRENLVFISYSRKDKDIAELISCKMEERGIQTWYAPRDITSGTYANAIVNAISKCTHFVTVISSNSMDSEHVLNEIDLAFDQLKRGIVLLPFRIDNQDLKAEFNYYLKRQQWMNAQKPPMEERVEEFIKKVFS